MTQAARGGPATIDRASLDRLIALGRVRGELGPDDLRAVLPIDAMRVEDVVLVILELEDAGVSVEPEAFGPRGDATAATLLPRPARRPAVAPEPRAASQAPPGATLRGAAPAAAPTGRAVPPGEDGRVHRTVALAGLATFVVLAAILLLI